MSERGEDQGRGRDERACAANERCAWCSAPLHRIDVHGHVQCRACGTNVDPCCGGERAG